MLTGAHSTTPAATLATPANLENRAIKCQRLTRGLSGAGQTALKCQQDAPSRVHSRPIVSVEVHRNKSEARGEAKTQALLMAPLSEHTLKAGARSAYGGNQSRAQQTVGCCRRMWPGIPGPSTCSYPRLWVSFARSCYAFRAFLAMKSNSTREAQNKPERRKSAHTMGV